MNNDNLKLDDGIIRKSLVRGFLFSAANTIICTILLVLFLSFPLVIVGGIFLKLCLLNKYDKYLNYNSLKKYYLTDIISTIVSFLLTFYFTSLATGLHASTLDDSSGEVVLYFFIMIIIIIISIVAIIMSIFTNKKHLKNYDETKQKYKEKLVLGKQEIKRIMISGGVGCLGILLIATGILICVSYKNKLLPPFVNVTYLADGEGYCTYGDDFKYVCQQDDGEYISKYSYDPKTRTITYYNDQNEPFMKEYIIYIDEETKDFIYKYSYYGKDKEQVDIRTSNPNIDYSNFGTEIKDISNINLYEKYGIGNNDSIIIQIDKEKKEYTSKNSSGTFKIYKMKTDELPNYIVFSHKTFNYETKEGYFIKEDGNLYADERINIPAYIKSN